MKLFSTHLQYIQVRSWELLTAQSDVSMLLIWQTITTRVAALVS